MMTTATCFSEVTKGLVRPLKKVTMLGVKERERESEYDCTKSFIKRIKSAIMKQASALGEN